ncbi:tRNA pseudouridine synthase A [Pyrobaculum neutrophilum]|uniref:tRNA pseudouridine synthase A n=1 Tax=Pyrobaculum neutrophilum (strain DSM 2338 / JCM 9278 / NBRC 100436 / V24Sta) TaxID=444157 RepID=TRUA_PYRNV|nr:tRNA pseudouridine synthase A [Pyrobaculum neutrophilum]B1YAT9.1 RecName: Full=tRNA pseudouridine synthase A; AltName: Full=tRNA pseudouridine(38-40) synthase; AltName: Full=tRNA pseudouridylate synthase I; AltName: Full=tRNA-uridine isomerase I [Pyrobaculum neutrophilum V24Sta]ACB39168.1 tRNA-pseudouridine synthase I [Pyrobaculum neutrophilum V24Sta]
MPYLYRIAYDGTLFYGFTGHPRSLEPHLRRALGDVLGRGSRTDPGVSAVGNVVMTSAKVQPAAANSKLPRGVWVWAAAEVPEGFNPRRARSRHYLYVAPHWGEDLDSMREAAELLAGTHDYASFVQRRGEPASTVTTIFSITVETRGDLVFLHFVGRGFRNKMIRKLAWAILAAGRGVLRKRDIADLLERPKPGAVPSAPAEGLVLLDIDYGVEFQVDYPSLRKAYRYFLWRYRYAAAHAAVFKAAGEALAAWEE